jgi:hypothetical protein
MFSVARYKVSTVAVDSSAISANNASHKISPNFPCISTGTSNSGSDNNCNSTDDCGDDGDEEEDDDIVVEQPY